MEFECKFSSEEQFFAKKPWHILIDVKKGRDGTIKVVVDDRSWRHAHHTICLDVASEERKLMHHHRAKCWRLDDYLEKDEATSMWLKSTNVGSWSEKCIYCEMSKITSSVGKWLTLVKSTNLAVNRLTNG